MHSTEHHRKLNSPETAEYLGISVSTLSKRRVFGDGPKYLKLGRRVVYDTRDLEAWLDTRRRASTSNADPAPDRCHTRAREAGSTSSAAAPERQPPRLKGRHAAAEVGL
jgi:predicted DNA-binding transcriptional regulator AlpA